MASTYTHFVEATIIFIGYRYTQALRAGGLLLLVTTVTVVAIVVVVVVVVDVVGAPKP